MNHSVILLHDNWVFIQNKNRISLKYRNVLIADTINDYSQLMLQLTVYNSEKLKTDNQSSFIKIQNINTNNVIVVRDHEIQSFYDFFKTIEQHTAFIREHTQVKNSVFQLS